MPRSTLKSNPKSAKLPRGEQRLVSLHTHCWLTAPRFSCRTSPHFPTTICTPTHPSMRCAPHTMLHSPHWTLGCSPAEGAIWHQAGAAYMGTQGSLGAYGYWFTVYWLWPLSLHISTQWHPYHTTNLCGRSSACVNSKATLHTVKTKLGSHFKLQDLGPTLSIVIKS